jgi:RNA polymerase sigma-70 factor (ECF subfamily)
MNEWAAGYADGLVNRETDRPGPGEADLEAEFEERVRDSSTLAFRVAYGVVRHREDAEDVAQEALAKAYQRFAQLRDRERFRAWLVRLTWRLAIDRVRADRRRAAREQGSALLAADAVVDQRPDAEEHARHLWRAIDALPEKLRIVVVLAAIEGHGIREVAALLALPEGTVKSRLFSARKSLAESLRWTVTNSPRR